MKKGEIINIADVTAKTEKDTIIPDTSVQDEGRDTVIVKQSIVDKILPNTATPVYNMLLLGTIIVLLGIGLRITGKVKQI